MKWTRLLIGMAIPLALCFGQTRRAENFTTKAGPVRLTPIMHAAVLLEAGGRAIYIDPAQGNFEGLPKADLIIITDIHPDHLVLQTIDSLKKASTQIFAPESVAKTVTAAQVMRYGETRRWESWIIEAVAAYNIKHGPSAGQVFHDKGRGNGYVFTYGGKRFYISGDTEGTTEMASLKNIDVALMCMNMPYTMSPEEAAEAVKSFRPKVVMPYHYRGSDLSVFQKGLVGTGIEARLLEWYPEGQGGAPGAPTAPNTQGGGRSSGSPATSGPPSPEILPDQRVVFRLIAPKAADVTLTADFWLQESRVEQWPWFRREFCEFAQVLFR
jgi:L-ascorbate metabolism protein UlaG (beta-lactamase superfamily)